MISLLFDKIFWISLLICATLAGFVIMFVLKPKSRPWIISLSCIVLIGTSIPCTVNLNRYYSAKGGIKGVLSTIINSENKAEIEEKTISLKNIMLTLDDDGNYSATIFPETNLNLDKDKTYSVSVNGSPCGYVEVNTDYILAKYTYNFYDKDKNFKTDTLEMYFTMDNYTTLEVLTRGGSEMVKYWNFYFNRNNFDITINEVEEDFSYEMPSSVNGEVVCTLYPQDTNETGAVSFSREVIVLTNTNRSATFECFVNDFYRIASFMTTAPVIVTINNNIVTVSLQEDLTKDELGYAINFYFSKKIPTLNPANPF